MKDFIYNQVIFKVNKFIKTIENPKNTFSLTDGYCNFCKIHVLDMIYSLGDKKDFYILYCGHRCFLDTVMWNKIAIDIEKLNIDIVSSNNIRSDKAILVNVDLTNLTKSEVAIFVRE